MSTRHEFSRSDRVRKALMREISDIIATEVKDPRLENQIISVTDVEVSPDLQHAKIFLSILAEAGIQAELMDILKNAQPQVRSAVGRRVRLRHTPTIEFRMDDSLERGTRITHLLDQIARGEV